MSTPDSTMPAREREASVAEPKADAILQNETGPFAAPEPRSTSLVERITAKISTVAAALAGVIMLLMTIHIVVDVMGRTLFNHPLAGTSELVQFWWMPVLALLGLAATELKNEHIHVSLMSDGRDHSLQQVVNILAGVVTAVAAGWMVYLAWGKLMDAFRIGESVVGLQWMPMWPIRVVVLFSFGLFLLAVLVRIRNFIVVRPTIDQEGGE